MIGNKVRQWTQKQFLNDIGKAIAKLRIHPNIVSATALLIAPISCYFIATGNYWFGAVFAILAAAVDFIDGSVARAMNKASKFGSYFDAMLDKYVECIIYLGFILSDLALEGFLAITGSLLISYAKPRVAIVIAVDNHDWPAIGERAERLIILILGLILSAIFPVVLGIPLLKIVLWIIIAITHIGAMQRIIYARKLIVAAGEN
jgi:archaetidylinositol phosphate synthase